MDLVKHLRYFATVAEELHFGRAAERLGMAQPPLSQRIQRLEAELGVRLFDRTRRTVTLTDAGRVLQGETRDILERVDRAMTLTHKAHEGEIGSLRAGVPPDLSGKALAAIVAEFASARDLRIDLQELTTSQQLRLLHDRQLDVGVVQRPADLTALDTAAQVDTPLGVVIPRDSALAARTDIALADLAGHPLVLFPRAGAEGHYDEILATCRTNGFMPASIQHARNPEFLLGLVLAGNAVAFDTGAMARKETRVVWRPLSGAAPVSRLAVVRPSRRPHPAAETFATAVTTVLSPAAEIGMADNPVAPAARPWAVVFGSGG